MGRYGEEEVIQWPIEVWDEPNLCGFWENADMQEYFKLFHRTFDAIKEVNPGFRVGGPAVCGGTDEKWIQAFMEYCHENHIPVDFVTRHHYTIDPPECIGHYAYSELMKAEDGFANLKQPEILLTVSRNIRVCRFISRSSTAPILLRASFMIQT